MTQSQNFYFSIFLTLNFAKVRYRLQNIEIYEVHIFVEISVSVLSLSSTNYQLLGRYLALKSVTRSTFV